MNVTLIGMAGAGKSHIGRKLAERLGLHFLDVDRDLWEAKYGKGIQEILDELGEEKYVAEEERLIIDGTRGRDNLLISPPGSVVYQEGALRHLKDISSIVYLRVPYETIESRLNAKPPRAIIGLGRKSLRELYEERHPLYERLADFALSTDGREEDDVIRAILDFLEKGNNSRFSF